MDELDITQDRMDKEIELSRKYYAADIPTGDPGICDACENPSPRLIKGECATCRDLRKKYKDLKHYKGDI